MGTIPGTKFSTSEPSGRIGQKPWSPPSQGGQEIARGIGQVGSALFNYALDVEKKKMVAELSQKKRLIDEAGWAMNEAITGDDETDKALLEKFQQDAQVASDLIQVLIDVPDGFVMAEELPDQLEGTVGDRGGGQGGDPFFVDEHEGIQKKAKHVLISPGTAPEQIQGWVLGHAGEIPQTA